MDRTTRLAAEIERAVFYKEGLSNEDKNELLVIAKGLKEGSRTLRELTRDKQLRNFNPNIENILVRTYNRSVK